MGVTYLCGNSIWIQSGYHIEKPENMSPIFANLMVSSLMIPNTKSGIRRQSVCYSTLPQCITFSRRFCSPRFSMTELYGNMKKTEITMSKVLTVLYLIMMSHCANIEQHGTRE